MKYLPHPTGRREFLISLAPLAYAAGIAWIAARVGRVSSLVAFAIWLAAAAALVWFVAGLALRRYTTRCPSCRKRLWRRQAGFLCRGCEVTWVCHTRGEPAQKEIPRTRFH